jgi:hypothetical protein
MQAQIQLVFKSAACVKWILLRAQAREPRGCRRMRQLAAKITQDEMREHAVLSDRLLQVQQQVQQPLQTRPQGQKSG